jgi:hypothetical protein
VGTYSSPNLNCKLGEIREKKRWLREFFSGIYGFFGSDEGNVPEFDIVVGEGDGEYIFVVFLDSLQILGQSFAHTGLHDGSIYFLFKYYYY